MARDILKCKENLTFQNCEWNKTSVDKIKKLRQVADMAFKSQQRMTEMPTKDSDVDAFIKWTYKIHCTLEPILWEVCCDIYTMFKIEHPNQGDEVRGFKWKLWHDTNNKQDADATPAPKKKKEKKAKSPPVTPKKKVKKTESSLIVPQTTLE